MIYFRHLTDVENELARLKALFKETHSQYDGRDPLSESLQYIPAHRTSTPTPRELETSERDTSILSCDDRICRSSQARPAAMDTIIQPSALRHIKANTDYGSPTSSTLELDNAREAIGTPFVFSQSSVRHVELEPSQGQFEWDERTGEAGEDRSADGMGTLPCERDMSGYLGRHMLSRI